LMSRSVVGVLSLLSTVTRLLFFIFLTVK
jgi:hypothetical protein